jgi:hypothetical protein
MYGDTMLTGGKNSSGASRSATDFKFSICACVNASDVLVTNIRHILPATLEALAPLDNFGHWIPELYAGLYHAPREI